MAHATAVSKLWSGLAITSQFGMAYFPKGTKWQVLSQTKEARFGDRSLYRRCSSGGLGTDGSSDLVPQNVTWDLSVAARSVWLRFVRRSPEHVNVPEEQTWQST